MPAAAKTLIHRGADLDEEAVDIPEIGNRLPMGLTGGGRLGPCPCLNSSHAGLLHIFGSKADLYAKRPLSRLAFHETAFQVAGCQLMLCKSQGGLPTKHLAIAVVGRYELPVQTKSLFVELN